MQIKKIILAEPRGFCAGVNRAIDIVDIALERYGSPLYVRHEIVHNHHVVNDFKKRGVVFIETLDEVPDDSMLIFSAHGTSPDVIERAQARGLQFIDAVCPLVTKVHLEIARAIKDGRKVIYIGHKGHQEVLGAMGYAKKDNDIFLVETCDDVENLQKKLAELSSQRDLDQKFSVATQTTLSLDDTAQVVEKLKETFSDIEFPRSDDICYATQNRQDAVKELVKVCDHILIIGSQNSSNTLRLLELAKKMGVPAQLVPDPDQFDPNVLTSDSTVIVSDPTVITSEASQSYPQGLTVGISSGASAPEFLVDTLISKLLGLSSRAQRGDLIEILNFKEEKVTFPLPKELV